MTQIMGRIDVRALIFLRYVCREAINLKIDICFSKIFDSVKVT